MKTTTTVNYNGLDYYVYGYYSKPEHGTFSLMDGGTPDLPASFDIQRVEVNGVNIIDELKESFLDELCELAIINLK